MVSMSGRVSYRGCAGPWRFDRRLKVVRRPREDKGERGRKEEGREDDIQRFT